MIESIDAVESQLRRAVAVRRYTEVQQLVSSLCEAAAREWTGLDAGHARQVFARLQGILDWTHAMLCIAQAATAADLHRLTLVSRYVRTDEASRNRLRAEV